MNVLRRALVVAGTVVLALVPLAAHADSVSARTLTEAWYQTACTTTSCTSGVPAVNPYPASTLHVGLTAGREDARTYIKLDSSSLPSGARLVGGTLDAPVAPDAGTRSPETAKLRACLVTKAFRSVEGSFGQAPSIDCKTSSSAAYRPGSPRATFGISLAPFAQRWSSGTADHGIALLPAEGDTGSWHVAFDGRARSGGSPLTATLVYELAETPSNESDFGAVVLPVTDEPIIDLPAQPPVILAAPQPLPPPALLEPAPLAAAGQVPEAEPTAGFQYPLALLVPLALVCLGGLLVRALTQPIPPR